MKKYLQACMRALALMVLAGTLLLPITSREASANLAAVCPEHNQTQCEMYAGACQWNAQYLTCLRVTCTASADCGGSGWSCTNGSCVFNNSCAPAGSIPIQFSGDCVAPKAIEGSCTNFIGQTEYYCTPEMSDMLAAAFIVVAGGILYMVRRRRVV